MVLAFIWPNTLHLSASHYLLEYLIVQPKADLYLWYDNPLVLFIYVICGLHQFKWMEVFKSWRRFFCHVKFFSSSCSLVEKVRWLQHNMLQLSWNGFQQASGQLDLILFSIKSVKTTQIPIKSFSYRNLRPLGISWSWLHEFRKLFRGGWAESNSPPSPGVCDPT